MICTHCSTSLSEPAAVMSENLEKKTKESMAFKIAFEREHPIERWSQTSSENFENYLLHVVLETRRKTRMKMNPVSV